MNRLFCKWFASILIAIMLLTPVASMEVEIDANDAIIVEEAVADHAENVPKTDNADAEDFELESIVTTADVDAVADELTVDFVDDDIQDELPASFEAEIALEEIDDGEVPFEPIPIDEKHFPDENFRKYILEKIDIDVADGALSKDEIQYTTSIDVGGNYNQKTNTYEGMGIKSLEGIKYLTFLMLLGCEGNPLTSLDCSNLQYLTYLECSDCENLTTLNVEGCSNLLVLICDGTSLESVDISECKVLLDGCVPENRKNWRSDDGRVAKGFLHDDDDNLGTYIKLRVDFGVKLIPLGETEKAPIPIDESHFPGEAFRNYILDKIDSDGDEKLSEGEIYKVDGFSLMTDNIEEHKIYGFDMDSLEGIKYFTEIEFLECCYNSIKTLDVSGLEKLEHLDCAHCDLTSLNVSGCVNLKILDCHGNSLKQVDISDCATIVSHFPEKITDKWQEDDKYLYPGFLTENSTVALFYDDDTKIIKEKTNAPVESSDPVSDAGETGAPAASETVPAPVVEAPAPVADAPAPAATVITAVKASNKAAVTAAPGTIAQINTGTKAGTKFKSSNKKVATVDANGNVTVKKEGKTKITFKVGKKKRTVTLKVVDPTIPKSVSLNMAGTNAVKAGDSVTLTATLPEGTSSGIKWKSSNKKIASVSNGVVTFKKKGKVTITATATRGKKKAKVTFKVSK